MSLSVAEAERKIISEWRTWSSQRGAYALSDIRTFYFEWLVPNRPDLLEFKCKYDRWQRVKGWLQNDESIQSKLRNPRA